jgi:putative glutamine transport system permease protein
MLQVLKDIFTGPNVTFMFNGILTSLELSVCTVLISILIGTILALCRNYEPKVLGKIASVYIEIFRNTPLLLWMLVCIFMVHWGKSLFRGGLALVLYTSAVMAEIIRGGLNAVPKGQFEAAHSQGFGFGRTLIYIILPQTFLKIIPSVMSQIITTIKDTSFLAQFAIAEFFYRTKVVIGGLAQNVPVRSAHIFTVYTFIAMIYFIINFSLSILARKIKIHGI